MDLLRLEFLKFSKHRGIRIGLILYALLMIGGYFAFREVAKISNNPVVDLRALTEFPEIWNLIAYLGNWMAFIILGFIGIQLISIEFSNKTFRQNIISGLTRRDFWMSKLLSAGIITLLSTLFYVLITVILGLIFSKETSSIVDGHSALSILYFSVMTFGYIIIGMFTAFIIRKGSIAMFVYFLYGMFVENFIRWAVHAKLIPEHKSMHYYPMNVLEDLTPLPYYAQMTKMSEAPIDLLLSQNGALIGTAVYLSLFIFIMYRLATKKDI